MAEQIKTSGVLPFALKDADEWSGDGALFPGKCRLKVQGYTTPLDSKQKKMVRMHHEIVEGPTEGENADANKGRNIFRNFSVSSPKALNFLKFYVRAVAGNAAFTGEEMKIDIANLVGREFWCDIRLTPYKNKAGETVKGGELVQSTIKAVDGTGAVVEVDASGTAADEDMF